ncbi:hypothetical protein [Streptomyces sp. NBC_01618]|uniref:hypothetical protein n=1 Tax=Streptomyces sp. NBC_01618 TaxID=2975900 RepID=UPI00386C3F57|nr:hypothetical protein OH735_32585 [Streptomyces sp. NBC_01618]
MCCGTTRPHALLADWERAKDASGEFGSIIANNNLNGPGCVTLNKGEYFKTNRCAEWKRGG